MIANRFYHLNNNNEIVFNNYDNILSATYDATHPDNRVNLLDKLINIFGEDFIMVRVCDYDDTIWVYGKAIELDRPPVSYDCINYLFRMNILKNNAFIQFSTKEQMLLAKMIFDTV